MGETVLIAGGKRMGRTLANEKAMREAIAAGKDVITGPRNGVYFAVKLNEDDTINYWPHPKRPEGV